MLCSVVILLAKRDSEGSSVVLIDSRRFLALENVSMASSRAIWTPGRPYLSCELFEVENYQEEIIMNLYQFSNKSLVSNRLSSMGPTNLERDTFVFLIIFSKGRHGLFDDVHPYFHSPATDRLKPELSQQCTLIWAMFSFKVTFM